MLHSTKRIARPLAIAATSVVATVAVAHEGDLKARDYKGAIDAPAWLADQQVGQESATTFQSSGVRLMAWFPVTTFNAANTSGNDVWGYVSPSGREYALMGLSNGTGFVDVTNPGSSSIVAFIAGPSSLWRNVKTYQQYAYSVSEGGGGIQVFDLANIDNGVVTLVNTVDAGAATPATHTMIINEQTGFLYRMGGGSNGLRIYSLANPTAPTLVATWNPKYTHDGVVYNYTSGPYAGKEIFFACGGTNGGQTNTGVDILDVTNKSNIVTIGRFTYANANFTHQIWLSEDRAYGYINDELDESNRGLYNVGRIVDLRNLAAPVAAGTYTTGITAVDHNEYVKGNRLFCSNYTIGLQVFDTTNPTSLQRVAWFDTHPEDDASPAATFNGLWSNYPYLPSGTILGSDIERGLFVWRLGTEPATIAIEGGAPALFNPAGQQVAVNVALQPGVSIASGGVVLKTTVDGVTTNTPMASDPAVAGRWTAVAPPVTCGKEIAWSVEAFVNDGTSVRSPAAGTYAAQSATSFSLAAQDACEAATGWTAGLAGDTATAGLWVNADPVATSAQPENDVSASGTRCWITGNGAVGGAVGAADVDGGTTTLTSPSYSVAGLQDPRVSYWRWYSNNQGADPNNDSMPVQISGNGGTTWVQVELVTENAGAWVKKEFRVLDFVTPTADAIRMRFIARDLGSGSVVEAGVDEISVFDLVCGVEGDLDGDGVVGGGDLAVLLLDYGACAGCPSDLDGNAMVDGGDIAYLLLLFG